MSNTYFVRTEPRATSSSLEPGIAARVYDPAWMLGRQWQIGELLGEDAGSAVNAALDSDVALISRYRRGGRKTFDAYDPATAPLETIVEAERHRTARTWTARLRMDTGRAFLRALDDAGMGTYRRAVSEAFRIRPAPALARTADPAGARLLDVAAGRIPDGEQLYETLASTLRSGAALPSIDGVDPGDAGAVRTAALAWLSWCDDTLMEGAASTAWQPETIDYSFSIATGSGMNAAVLDAEGYRGGSLEWHSFDAHPIPRRADFVRQPQVSGLPAGVQFRGMPNARWWEFEDATIDPGSIDAGPSDVARMAFLEFALVYGSDFFAVPLRLPIGSLTRITSLVVTDSFGMQLSIESANRRQGALGAPRFCLFGLTEIGPAVAGVDPVSDVLFLAPVACQVLSTSPVEDVLLLRDEMANLAWAVERRYEGGRGTKIERHETTVLAAPEPPPPTIETELRYELGSTVPPYWFPLVPTGSQAGVGLELQRMSNQPASVVPLGHLHDLGGPPIHDAEVPREGTRLLRDYAMTRWTNGAVFVWSRRRREIGRGEGSSGLRFDIAAQV